MSFLLTANDQKTSIPLPSATLLTLPVNLAGRLLLLLSGTCGLMWAEKVLS